MILRNTLKISSIVIFVLLTIFISLQSSFHAIAVETGIVIDVKETGNGNQVPIFTSCDGLLIPGGSVSSIFSVRNNCSFSIVMDSFQLGDFKIKDNSDNVLSSESQKYIDFTKNVNYRIMRGDLLLFSSSVENLINKTVSVKSDVECTLQPGEIKKVKIVADMNEEAGNSVQRLKSTFIIAMNFRAVTSSGGGDTPTVPEPGTPTVPELGTPTVPDPSTPTVPEPGTPTVPEPGTPTVPEPGTPTVPEPGTPTVPEPGTPTVPEPGTPTVPEPGTPTVPEPGTPTVPDPDGPKVVARLIQTGSPVDMTVVITIGWCFIGGGSVLLYKKKK
ncbi:MAG: hypothetical protein ACREV6_08540 [Clostridium sp.]|uniref:hypothetical protein n=1 Tax=Clostridium sp. TaxID=1506 RepID=UPI003D6C82A0